MSPDALADRYAEIDRGWRACLWASVAVALELLHVGV